MVLFCAQLRRSPFDVRWTPAPRCRSAAVQYTKSTWDFGVKNEALSVPAEPDPTRCPISKEESGGSGSDDL